ncbi:NAD-dependent epimerase/dehydratase family protein [Pseudomonadales bacterium]|nr:NAD-dependent epimerase/dehydratase family protein [Pseudomonadales bacterium]
MDIKVAVVGGSGVVGRAILEDLTVAGINYVALSRRPPDLADGHFVALDLNDASQCHQVVDSHLRDVTHVVYAALYEQPGLIAGWQNDEQMQQNLTMLSNLMTPLSKQSFQLQHITLLQGTKAYGAHVAPMTIPGREREARHPHKNFYWLQEDFLREQAAQHNWAFTIWRPQIIFGHALNAPMNMLAALGAYAALQSHQGLSLSYPGGPSGVMEAIDADILARAIRFAWSNDAFVNETFNITNGDVFRMQDIWPILCDIFNMDAGPPAPRLLSETCYDQETIWTEIVAHHNLKPHSLRGVVGDSFFYADALFNAGGTQPPPPSLLSTIKLREAGFAECVDTEVMLRRWFAKLQDLAILPNPRK